MSAVINWLPLTYFMLEKAVLVGRKVVPANTEFLSRFNESCSVNKSTVAGAVSKDFSMWDEKASGSLLDNVKVSTWVRPSPWKPQQPRVAHSGFIPASCPADMGTAVGAENGTRSQMLRTDTHTHTPRKYLNLGRGSAQKSGRVKWLKYSFFFWVGRGSHAASDQSDLSCPCWLALQALLHPNAVPPGGPCTVPVLESLRRSSGAGAWLSLCHLPREPCLYTMKVFQALLHFSSPFTQQKKTEGGVRIAPLCFIPSCAIDLPGDKRCSDGRPQLWPNCHLNENDADCF